MPFFRRKKDKDDLKLNKKSLKKFNNAVLTGKREKRRIGATKQVSRSDSKISVDEQILEFSKGDIVEVKGMLNERLNGQQGVIVEYVKERRLWKVQIGERISQVKTRNLMKSEKREAATKQSMLSPKRASKSFGRSASLKRKPDEVKDPDDAFSNIVEFLETVDISSRFAEQMDETCTSLELLRSRYLHNEKLCKRQGLKISMMEKMLSREDIGRAGEDAERVETLTTHVNNLSTQLEIMIDEHEEMSNELKAKNYEKMLESQAHKNKMQKVNQVCQHLADQLEETVDQLKQCEHQKQAVLETYNSQLLTVENENKELKLQVESLREENARLQNRMSYKRKS